MIPALGTRAAWREDFVGEKKGWGSTVLGWFIVQDENAASGAPGEVSADQVPAEAPAEGQAAPAFFQTPPPSAPGGRVDFEAVFEAAGIDAEERDRVAKAIELLASLPADTPTAVKKQIVEASLKAFGVPLEKIIEGGAGQIQALEGYIRAGAADTQKLLEESNERIRKYEEEIQHIRTVMEQRVQEQQAVATSCNARKLEVQRMLEFFGQEAVARVVKASPRLHDPSGQSPSTT
jgi:hypothetical protein